jgi:cytosine/adenosine deaminase-related metal-dependent hydrolase
MASILIDNAALLTFDEADRFIERGSLLIEGNIISQVGEVVRKKVDRVIDGRRFLALPGFVNAHTHTPGALSAGTQDSASHPAFMWLNQADTSGRTPREVYVSAMLNAAQMLLGGITTSIDHFPAQNFGPEDVAAVVEAYRDSGMRTVLALRVFDDDFGDIFPSDRPLPADLAKDLERIKPLPPKPLPQTRKLLEDAIRLYHRPRERLSVFPSPTNPVRCSDELLTLCRDLAEQHDLGIHTHLLESKVQATLAQRRYGRTMVQHLERLGLLSARLSCAHTIWIEPEDIDRLAAAGTVVVHNPESNLKLGTGIAPIAKMLASGVTVALGTDGSVTNDNLVLHEAIRLAAILGRVAERERSKWVPARRSPWPPRAAQRRYSCRAASGACRRAIAPTWCSTTSIRRPGLRSTIRCSRWCSPRPAAACTRSSSTATSSWRSGRSRPSTPPRSSPKPSPCCAPSASAIASSTASRAA